MSGAYHPTPMTPMSLCCAAAVDGALKGSRNPDRCFAELFYRQQKHAQLRNILDQLQLLASFIGAVKVEDVWGAIVEIPQVKG